MMIQERKSDEKDHKTKKIICNDDFVKDEDYDKIM